MPEPPDHLGDDPTGRPSPPPPRERGCLLTTGSGILNCVLLAEVEQMVLFHGYTWQPTPSEPLRAPTSPIWVRRGVGARPDRCFVGTDRLVDLDFEVRRPGSFRKVVGSRSLRNANRDRRNRRTRAAQALNNSERARASVGAPDTPNRMSGAEWAPDVLAASIQPRRSTVAPGEPVPSFLVCGAGFVGSGTRSGYGSTTVAPMPHHLVGSTEICDGAPLTGARGHIRPRHLLNRLARRIAGVSVVTRRP